MDSDQEVTREEFFHAINQLDVIIALPNGWNEETGYLSVFKMRHTGKIVGESTGVEYKNNVRYFLRP